MKKLKAAVIGAGFIGEVHIEAIRRLGFAEVVAVAQSSREKAERRAQELCIPRAYGDYRDIFEDEEIDVVHNCTPNHLHYELNREILRRGKHLLSEKPLTFTSAEARELSLLAKEAGVLAGINYNYRQFPMVQHMQRLARSGEIGDVRIVRGQYLQDWLMYDTDYNWRLEPEFGGRTRAIGDIGSHLLDLAQYITGRSITEVLADVATLIPTRVKPEDRHATFQSAGGGSGERIAISTEDYSSILVKFDDGSRGVFTVSQVSPGYKNGLQLHLDGSKASCGWRQEQPFKLWTGYRGQPNAIVLRDPELVSHDVLPYIHYPAGHEEAWADSQKNMMKQFYEAIRNGERSLPHSIATFEEGYTIMLIIEAIVKSAETGSWVPIIH